MRYFRRLHNNFLENIVLPLGDQLFGTAFISELKRLRKEQLFDEKKIEALQFERLQKLLTHAVNNIPFYNAQSNRLLIGKSPSIERFPIITKKKVKENLDSFLWHPGRKQRLVVERSSGSSGIQGEVYMSKKEQSVIQAQQTLFWEWSSYELGSRMLQTGMTLKRGLKKSLKDFFLRTNYVSAFQLEESAILTILNNLRVSQVDFFGGYASSLYLYAKVAKKNNIKDISFRSVISWGDKMFDHYRTLIEEQFKTKVYDTYGTTEGFMIAAQKDLPYYYINSTNVYLELLDDEGNPVADGEIGNVVVTSLRAYEMPLIRYSLGDLAVKLPKNSYPQKRSLPFPLLKKVIGRDTDIVRTSSGKNMIVHFFTAIFEHIPQIIQFRVVQENTDGILIEYIKADEFPENILGLIIDKIQAHLGEPFDIVFKEVKHIPPSPSGKPQIVLSKLKRV